MRDPLINEKIFRLHDSYITSQINILTPPMRQKKIGTPLQIKTSSGVIKMKLKI
jgi:hypothetical protein